MPSFLYFILRSKSFHNFELLSDAGNVWSAIFLRRTARSSLPCSGKLGTILNSCTCYFPTFFSNHCCYITKTEEDLLCRYDWVSGNKLTGCHAPQLFHWMEEVHSDMAALARYTNITTVYSHHSKWPGKTVFPLLPPSLAFENVLGLRIGLILIYILLRLNR